MLSKRGIKAETNALRPDLELYFQAAENAYHTNNPNGNFLLSIAENKLCWHMLANRLEKAAENPLPDWVASYTDTRGAASFRKALNQFLEEYFAKTALDADCIALAAGATAVIEITSFCLGDAGDVVLIPAPAYSVYQQDIGIKAGLERMDVSVPNVFDSDQSWLSIEALEASLQVCEEQGKKAACLILTAPDNPTGVIYSAVFLEAVADWCIANEIHLIVNEIYGLSTIDTSHKELVEDYPSGLRWTSFLQIVRQRKSPFLHWWYALSKDFGISGCRVGMLYSENKALIRAFANVAAPHMISNHTQWLLEQVFEDATFLKNMIQENRRLLTKSYLLVTQTLRKVNIPFTPAYGSLFVWINMRTYLNENSAQAELALWQDIFEKTGILFTPSLGFGQQDFGYFRIVYTVVSGDALKVALERFENYIHKHKTAKK